METVLIFFWTSSLDMAATKPSLMDFAWEVFRNQLSSLSFYCWENKTPERECSMPTVLNFPTKARGMANNQKPGTKKCFWAQCLAGLFTFPESICLESVDLTIVLPGHGTRPSPSIHQPFKGQCDTWMPSSLGSKAPEISSLDFYVKFVRLFKNANHLQYTPLSLAKSNFPVPL